MVRLFSALALLILSASVALAGPFRDWVNDVRPGILIPKRGNVSPQPRPIPSIAVPGCPCQPVCPCPGGVCPVCPGNGHSAQPIGPIINVSSDPRPIVIQPCPGGNCPLPR